MEVVVGVSDVYEISGESAGNIHILDGAVLDAPHLKKADNVYISAGGHLEAPLLTDYNSVVVSPDGGSFN